MTKGSLEGGLLLFKLFWLTRARSIVLILSLVSAAYATQPEFSIIIAEPPANLYFATLPQIVNVSGTFSINSAQDFNLAVKRTADPDTAYTNLVSVNAIPGNIWGPFPWTITTAAAYGSYTLRVTAKHGNRDYVQTKVITVHPLLTTSTPNIPVIRGNPAAPAIARRILKHNGIPNNYNGVNLVNAVAREMGPRNTFRLVSRKDRVAYQLAVYSYLKTFVVSLP